MPRTENGKTYRWAHPSDWLNDHVDESRGNNAELIAIIDTLMSKLTEDDLQDLFQSEMERDGYFQPEGEDKDDENAEETR